MDIAKLSLIEKIGQKFMFGVNASNTDVIVELIKKYSIGGVILYKRNYNTYDDMLKVIKKFKDANKDNKIPLFISIDQEGGRVNRMPSEIMNIKNNYDMSKKDIELISKNGILVGKMLSSMGINMNFAPVLDLCEDNNSKILYNRCFFGDEDNVYRCGKAYVKGLNDSNVISVIKHFPGHGISRLDSHFFIPYVFDSGKLFDKHIKPFSNIIKDDIDAIMMGHLVIRGLTRCLPASLSYDFIQNELRKKYKYTGLVITDELSMLSRNLFYRINLNKNVFKSGSDIILCKIKEKDNVNIIDKYISFVNNNMEYMDMIDDSVRRIIDIKKKYNISDDAEKLGLDINLINREIDSINSGC